MKAVNLQTHEIVVYPKRVRLFWMRSLIALPFLFVVSMDVFVLWVLWSHAHIDAITHGVYVVAIMLAIGTVYTGGWVIFMLLYGVRWRGPAIMINAQGLSMNFPLRLTFSRPIRQSFIPWEEIEWISSFKGGMYTGLALSLKDPARYWSLYGYGKYRQWRRGSSTGAHIKIVQYVLSCSATQILQRIEESYSSELLRHDVTIKW